MTTGRRPADHGITSFKEAAAGPDAKQPVTSSMRRVRALWDIASEAGRRVAVVAEVAKGGPGAAPAGPDPRAAAAPAGAARDLKAEALRDPVLQSLLDVIPGEVKDITELKPS